MEMLINEEMYASDETWLHWFEKCAVKRCSLDEQARLKRQIESSFRREIVRHDGVEISDFCDEDLCDLFDQHFYLHGSADNPKALKQYYLDRIDPQNPNSLKMIVCGTFFSPRKGRIKDIVRETIPVVKGWKARWVVGDDGKKKLFWERPEETLDDNEACRHEPVCYNDAFTYLARRENHWQPKAAELIDYLCAGFKKRSYEVPIILFAILHGISAQNRVIQDALGIKQVQCYDRFKKLQTMMWQHLKEKRITRADTTFVSALRKEVVSRLTKEQIERFQKEIGEEWK